MQQALASVRLAEEQLYAGLAAMEDDRATLLRQLDLIEADINNEIAINNLELTLEAQELTNTIISGGLNLLRGLLEGREETALLLGNIAKEGFPTVTGLSSDVTSAGRVGVLTAAFATRETLSTGQTIAKAAQKTIDVAFAVLENRLEAEIADNEEAIKRRAFLEQLQGIYADSLAGMRGVDALSVAYVRALEDYQNAVSDGQAVLAERETFRKRAAVAVQGTRTRDVAFRAFRTEALEQYQTLLDWAAKYTYLAAQAYDYETGLLGSDAGRQFLGEIVSSRALGVLGEDGQPTFAASENGDPGLSGLLAKLKGDWDVVEGRLGFNNPDQNGTTFSLRRELFRIPDGEEHDDQWRQVLETLVLPNLLGDAQVASHALQIDTFDGTPQPGFVIPFSSQIQAGRNFFGLPLAAGDSAFSESNFATKIHTLGVVFEGYKGIAPCEICGGTGPGDASHNHGDALSATPYVYLLPGGTDTMRSPPLGDGSALRTWNVRDHALPLPFNIGDDPNSETEFFTGDSSLDGEFQAPRKHQAFRATDTTARFYTDFLDEHTSSRLVGRTVWNDGWKLVIPASDLLSDPDEGIRRFVETVTDIKIHLKTYSYSGN